MIDFSTAAGEPAKTGAAPKSPQTKTLARKALSDGDPLPEPRPPQPPPPPDPANAKEATITTDQFHSTVLLALIGTRGQISSTGNGELLNGKRSFVRWGGVVKAKVPSLKDIVFDFPVLKKDRPGPFTGDYSIKVNNVHSVVGFNTFTGSISNGLKFELKLSSNSPTLVVGGGPDVRMKNMKIAVTFKGLRAVDGKLAYSDVDVKFDADMDVNNVPDFLLDLVSDFKSDTKKKIQSLLREKLLAAATKAAINEALNAVVKQRIEGLGKIIRVTVRQDALVVKYVPARVIGPVVPRAPLQPAVKVGGR